MKIKPLIEESEQDTRIYLAALHRMIALHGWSELTANHVSARTKENNEHFLLNPMGLLFEEVTASSLVKINMAGERLDESDYTVNYAGYIIHSTVLSARPEINCVIHTHSLNGKAVSVLKDPLMIEDQGSMLHYNRIGYHDYEGPERHKDACASLKESLGEKNTCLILRNHGLLVTGRTIAEAFFNYFYLESACAIHLKTAAVGAKIWPAKESVKLKTQNTLDELMSGGLGAHDKSIGILDIQFAALLRKLDRMNSDYKS